MILESFDTNSNVSILVKSVLIDPSLAWHQKLRPAQFTQIVTTPGSKIYIWKVVLVL